jgi:hypothetical protein
VGCDPLREVPSLRGRRSIFLKRQVLRTRRPTGLDRATVTRERSLVKLEPRADVDGRGRYARSVGHISPAGAEAAKSGVNPALSRNCDAPLRG